MKLENIQPIASKQKQTILIVDDDPDIRSNLINVLKPHYAVFEACDGLDALRMIDQEHPQLMLLDVRMPVMDGLGVLRAMQARASEVTVLMLTGENDMDIVKEVLDLGAREYITKPFEVNIIRKEIAWLLAGSEATIPQGGRPWRIASA